jgi:RNA polymerase sigma-70 factor (ECF subfamily)
MPDWEEVEEPRFLKEAQAGNVESFSEIYTRYAEGIFRFLFLHLDNRLDAEDLTGEVFYRAYKALPEYKLQGVPFTAFLYRIARNALTDFYRKSRHAKNLVSLDEVDESQGLASDSNGRFQEKVDRRELVSLLEGLKAEYRMVISLRFFSGLSPEETARVMNRSVGAVRVLQFRALAVLRTKLTQDQSGEIGE